MIALPSPNHDARPDGTPIDMLVLHYTGMPTAADALARLTDPAAQVSAHYVIDEDGTTYRMVPEERRAWHAGKAFWRGETAINARSIGIELVNPGHEFGYRPFPAAQMAALIPLARAILTRHPIPARNVVAHADVAPTRKEDPGEYFDWALLARHGIGLWPEPAAGAGTVANWQERLALLGYDLSDPGKALIAFRRHYRPERLAGAIDAETAARLDSLAALVNEKQA